MRTQSLSIFSARWLYVMLLAVGVMLATIHWQMPIIGGSAEYPVQDCGKNWILRLTLPNGDECTLGIENAAKVRADAKKDEAEFRARTGNHSTPVAGSQDEVLARLVEQWMRWLSR